MLLMMNNWLIVKINLIQSVTLWCPLKIHPHFGLDLQGVTEEIQNPDGVTEWC